MAPNELVGIITAAAAALVAFLAWLVKYRKKVNIISGYDEQLYRDKNGLANYVGGTLLITGVAGLVFSIALIIFPAYIGVLVACYAVSIVAGTLTAAIGVNKFRIK